MIEVGTDDNDNGMLESYEVDYTEYVCDGVGMDSLVNTGTILPGHPDCAYGGVMIEVGTDDNDNGMLDSFEIDSTEYVCDGADGTDGVDGAQGPAGPTGMAGMSSLITTSTEPAGSNCAAGGIKIGIGVDDNGDMQLQNSEIDSTLFVCDGEDGVAISIPWVDITGIPSDIADGDDDTTYDGSSFAVSDQACQSGQVMMGINPVGQPICVIDNDTTVSGACPSTDYYMYGISSSGYVMCHQVQDYDGNDFAVSNQQCSTGQVMKGITSNGLVICVTDVDTSFSGLCATGQVMRGVSSSGSAICISDSDTTYDGYDFAESNQMCQYGYSVYGISSNGQVICLQTQINAGSGLQLQGYTLSIADYGCIAGEVMKRNAGNYGWECVADEDTTYDGSNFATSNQVCSTGQKVSGINPAGDIICVVDIDTTYDGTDFALSGQACPSGEVIRAISSSGYVLCQIDVDTDTQLSESQVDAYVSNNGYLQAGQVATIAITGSWYDLNGIPSDIADGDKDTTYSGTDFATSGQTCPTGQYVEEIDSNGVIQCSEPESGSAIMPGTLTGGSYDTDAVLTHYSDHVVYQQFFATDSGYYDKITYFYTGNIVNPNTWHGSVYVAIYDDNQGHPGNVLSYNSHNNGPNHNPQTHIPNNYYNETLSGGVYLDDGESYWVAIHTETNNFDPFMLVKNTDYEGNLGLVQYAPLYTNGNAWFNNPSTQIDDTRAFWFMIS